MVTGNGFAYKIEFGVYGVRGDDLLVRYEGGYRRGIEHGTGWRDKPCIWVSDGAFSTIEIYARFKDDNDD